MLNFKGIMLPFLFLCSLGTLATPVVLLWMNGTVLNEMISATEYSDSYRVLYWLLLLTSILSSLSCIILLMAGNRSVQK